jgi:hypothetical protein
VATAEQLVPARSLFQVTDDLLQCFELYDVAADEDKPALEREIQRIIAVELATKVDGISFFQKRCDAEVALLQDVTKEIETRIGSWNKRKQRVRDMVKGAMNHIGASLLKGKVHSISLSTGRESIEITDESKIPPTYIIEQVVRTVDRKALTAALKQGAVIPGAQLKRGDDILTIR